MLAVSASFIEIQDFIVEICINDFSNILSKSFADCLFSLMMFWEFIERQIGGQLLNLLVLYSMNHSR
jgi:hypothetical protein